MCITPKYLDFPSYSLELRKFSKDCESDVNHFQDVEDISKQNMNLSLKLLFRKLFRVGHLGNIFLLLSYFFSGLRSRKPYKWIWPYSARLVLWNLLNAPVITYVAVKMFRRTITSHNSYFLNLWLQPATSPVEDNLFKL